MMASNLLSRLLPSASDEPFETRPLAMQPRRYSSSTDEHHDMDIDEENLGARFEPQDLEHLLEEAASSHITTESTAFLAHHNERAPPGINTASRGAAWRQPPAGRAPPLDDDDDDDDVPQSLMLEEGGAATPNPTKGGRGGGLPPPVPGPSTHHARAQWDATRRQQRLHEDGRRDTRARTWAQGARLGQTAGDPREKALWLWANQTDLDNFLAEVYDYYVGCGISSIVLRNILMLLQTAFVVAFLTTLTWCIEYSKISHSHKLSEILVPQCTKRYGEIIRPCNSY
jgi:autophagy-related protein 9